MARTKQEWINLAQRRIRNILNKYTCCPIRMLEAKISEAGPGNQRPNPLSISIALNQMAATGSILRLPKQTAIETPFYAPLGVDTSTATFQQVATMRRYLYLLHKAQTQHNEFCSDILEQIVDRALEQAHAHFLTRFPNPHLPASRPLDFVAEIGGTLCGGELKNFREWIYPESVEIWSTISKCCELDALPVLVTRKIPYVTYLFFQRIGMVGYQTHFQYFHPVTEPELARVRHVDGLGYKDIRFALDPDAHLLSFFQNSLPQISPTFKSRFTQNKALLLDFADSQRLADKSLQSSMRVRVFQSAWKAFFGSPHDEFFT